jgi:hypothetical protein
MPAPWARGNQAEFAMLKTALLAAAATIALAPAAHAATGIGDVFYIAMENHNWTQPSSVTGINPILGNPAAPFINSLVTPGNPNAANVSYASNYQNVPGIHPSEPNYVWMDAGRAGLLNDSDPYPNNIVNGPSLSALLQSSGSSWRAYQEDTNLLTTANQNINTPGAIGTLTNNVAPSSLYTVPLTSFSGASSTYTNPYNGSNQYNYAPKHDPQAFFTATNGGNNPTPSNPEAQFYAPLQQLQSDLNNNTVARYNWVTPDQYNDMHSALNTNFIYHGVTYGAGTDEEQIALGDNFLSQIVPMIEASQAFQNNGEIVIWNDETENEGNPPQPGFSSMEIIISPLAKGNAYTNNILYTHSNDLNTLQDIFGLRGTPLGGAAGATSMIDLYRPTAFSVPEPGTWALMFAGLFGLGGALRMRRQRGFAAA